MNLQEGSRPRLTTSSATEHGGRRVRGRSSCGVGTAAAARLPALACCGDSPPSPTQRASARRAGRVSAPAPLPRVDTAGLPPALLDLDKLVGLVTLELVGLLLDDLLVRQRHGSHRSSAERLRQRERRHLSEDAQRQRCAASAATGRTEGDGGTVCGTGGLGFRVGAAAEQPPWRGCLAQDRKEFRFGLETRIPGLADSFSRYPRYMAGYGGIWRDMAGYRGIPGDTGR